MPISCDATAFYYGTVTVTRMYVGTTVVWPCYDCDIPDVELLDPVYADALMYVPTVCYATSGPSKLSDKVSEIELTKGPAYVGIWSITFGTVDKTWGFYPPAEEDIGEIMVEAELPNIDNVGVTKSAVSFYITVNNEIPVADEGLLLVVDNLEVEVVASVFGGTQILARANRATPDPPLEVQASTDLPLDTEVKIIVDFYHDLTTDRLVIYYDGLIVGEILG